MDQASDNSGNVMSVYEFSNHINQGIGDHLLLASDISFFHTLENKLHQMRHAALQRIQ